jgi:hypothetical protein
MMDSTADRLRTGPLIGPFVDGRFDGSLEKPLRTPVGSTVGCQIDRQLGPLILLIFLALFCQFCAQYNSRLRTHFLLCAGFSSLENQPNRDRHYAPSHAFQFVNQTRTKSGRTALLSYSLLILLYFLLSPAVTIKLQINWCRGALGSHAVMANARPPSHGLVHSSAGIARSEPPDWLAPRPSTEQRSSQTERPTP